jgi:hypothetical protein
MCEDFMSAALCRHSLLLAMLYDATLKFPAKHSTKKLELRGKLTRRPSAWAPEDADEEEEAEVASKLHWWQFGALSRRVMTWNWVQYQQLR